MRNPVCRLVLLAACLPSLTGNGAEPPPSADKVAAEMKRAAEFYRTRVATHGGYVYYYSPDLKRRMGEGVASADQIWVQPPGTPTVGLAYLAAWTATKDAWYLEAATETARALAFGQLKSGGWTNCIDFDRRGSLLADYKNGQGRGKNNSTLDDNISQSALICLMRVDQALDFKDAEIHAAASSALDALLAAQFANGGFPQVWTGPVEDRPVVPAKYPDYDWRTENRIKAYWTMYTLNDGLAGDVAQTLIAAHEIYQDGRAEKALQELGDFLVLAQMPDPQPAWAQQYDVEMRPIWARKFEPPAIAGRESQDAIAALLLIYRQTGDAKYLQPIPRAIEYLRKSLLADGRLARYYELQTNRPLYMTSKYVLTYDDADVPRHYGWKGDSRLDNLNRQYQSLSSGKAETATSSSKSNQTRQVGDILAALDSQGRWLSTYDGSPMVGQPKFRPDEQYLSSEVFSRNLTVLSEFLASQR
ncbi:MAG: pectate lyase [Pirellulales bacterium]